MTVPAVTRSELVQAVLEDPAEALRHTRAAPVVAALNERWAAQRKRVLAAAGNPTVSLIMAAYNTADTIDRAIGSVLAQTYAQLELVVVDAASDDDTAARAEDWTQRDNRVRLVRSDAQRGAAAARNLGLAAARGDYLSFHDADDVSHPERIERQLAALLATPGARVCICNFVRETPEGRRVVVNGRRFAKNALSMLFPRDPVFERVGYMRPLTIAEDTDYYERIRASFGVASEVHLFQTLYRARFDPESLLFSQSDTRWDPATLSVTFERTAEHQREYEAIYDRAAKIRAGELTPYVSADATPPT